MKELCGLSKDALRAQLAANGYRPFHADQILQWVYRKHERSFAAMTNLDKGLRQWLTGHLDYPVLVGESVVLSSDGETEKFLWKLRDGQLVESVLIYSDMRRTVCVSSQVGCPARCAFCASGKQGLKRQLTAAEIVEQVVHIDAYLQSKGQRVSHVVFMGMGEPLENTASVFQAIHLLSAPWALGLSQRRITVSTVGVVEGIEQLCESGLRVNLALSLHAPNQKLRQKIIPYARRYELQTVLRSVDAYAAATGRDVTLEYTLLSGINDQPEHAAELARVAKERQCTVNLIPYNPVVGLRLERPSTSAIRDFRRVLDHERVVHTCRYTKGDDIAAACGQLALQKTV